MEWGEKGAKEEEKEERRVSKGSNGRLHGEAVVVMVTHRAQVSGFRNVCAVCTHALTRTHTHTHTLVIILSPSVVWVCKCVCDDRCALLSESECLHFRR